MQLSPLLVEDGPPETRRRTWRARLTTRPWRPWRATEVIVPKVPYRGAVTLDRQTLLMHPATYARLKRDLG